MIRQGIGQLASSGVQITTTSTVTTELLFENRTHENKVQNAIGDIALDTTVAQLEAFRTVPNLLAEMLRISGAPTARGFSLSLLNFPTEAQVGSTLTVSGTVRFDRGAWSATGSSTPPYGVATSAELTETLTNTNTSLTVPSVQSRVVDLSYSSSLSVPAQLGTYSFTAEVSHGAGTPYLDASVPARVASRAPPNCAASRPSSTALMC